MRDCIESLATGQYKILFWFIVGILFIYIPFMFAYLSKRKEKGRVFDHDHRDAVKVYLKIDLIGTLHVFSVNGKEPTPFYEALRQGIYLLPGKNIVGIQYQWSERDTFSLKRSKDHVIKPTKLTIFVEEGKSYQISYDHATECFEFEELA